MIMWTKIKVAALLIAAAGIVTAGGLGTVALLSAQTAPLSQSHPAGGLVAGNSAAVAEAFDRTPGLVASLDNGVAIKLEGVTYDDAGKKTWWNADGTRLKNGPYGRIPFDSFVTPPGHISPTFAIEAKHSVKGNPDPATLEVSLTGAEIQRSGSIGTRPGKVIEIWTEVLPPTAPGETVRANIASGVWKTVGASMKNGQGSILKTTSHLRGSEPTEIYFFSPFLRDHGYAGIVIDATGKIFAQDDLRMVALDRTGVTHVGSSRGRDQSENSVTAEFDVQLPLESIDHWEVQVRPFDQWIEIRNIAVRPGQNTPPQIVTSDHPK